MELAERTAELRQKYTDYTLSSETVSEARKIVDQASHMELELVDRFLEIAHSDESPIKLTPLEIQIALGSIRDAIRDAVWNQVESAKSIIAKDVDDE